MIEMLDNFRPQIEGLCRKHHVCRLELFGSAASGKFYNADSDIDFLVEFEQFKRGEYTDHYFGLYEDLESLLGRKIDLVVTRAVKNPYFLEKLEQSRELLYAA
jgi:predicted nucleotidyltransferase